jgi:hypothetical protein
MHISEIISQRPEKKGGSERAELIKFFVDNLRNKVHIFREPFTHGVWDIATNVFTSREWTTLAGDSRFQGSCYGGWAYTKILANRICRYNWATVTEESWDGSQFLQ